MLALTAWLTARTQTNPFPRALARWGSFMAAKGKPLAPADPSPAAFGEWFAALGEKLDGMDVDWVGELYLTACELNGWAPQAAATVANSAIVAAEPDTGIDQSDAYPDVMVDNPDDNDSDEVDGPPHSMAIARPATTLDARQITPTEAAERFVEWCRIEGRCGTYSNTDLTELTREFFEAQGLDVLADMKFRPALQRLSRDVTKASVDDGSKRRRMWTIHDSDEDPTPWEDLPEARLRVAA